MLNWECIDPKTVAGIQQLSFIPSLVVPSLHGDLTSVSGSESGGVRRHVEKSENESKYQQLVLATWWKRASKRH